MISGPGLHTGAPCWVHLHREAGAVRFRRGRQDIPAHAAFAVDTTRSTTLGAGGYRVATVEHMLAALHACGWWEGLVIEVSADELPILDGSAAPWLELVGALGPPPPPPPGFAVRRELSLRCDEAECRVSPGPRHLCAEIDFPHPAIAAQRWCGPPGDFSALLPARTFGFLSDLEGLRAQGLATAASLENALVYGAEGPLTPLRFPDEPARHKALDALGDFYLLGRPLLGRLSVSRGSHRAHLHFVRALLPMLVSSS